MKYGNFCDLLNNCNGLFDVLYDGEAWTRNIHVIIAHLFDLAYHCGFPFSHIHYGNNKLRQMEMNFC